MSKVFPNDSRMTTDLRANLLSVPQISLVVVLSFIVTMTYLYPQLAVDADPSVNDPALQIEYVFKNMNFPSSMTLLGPEDNMAYLGVYLIRDFDNLAFLFRS